MLKFLWEGSRTILFSTNKQKADEITNIKIEDERLRNFRKLLNYNDKSIISESVSIINLHNRGQHSESEYRKDELSKKYKLRGLIICHMITTGDMSLVLDEIQEINENKNKIECFGWWIKNYNNISILISPSELDDIDSIHVKILEINRKLVKNYINIHLTGTVDECNNILKIIEKMKKNKIIKYSNLMHFINESGFLMSIKIQMDFDDV